MRLVFGLLVVCQVYAQTYPDAAALLAGREAALERYRSYELTADSTMFQFPMTVTLQAVNPGKKRMEMKTAGMVSTVVISDGESSWMYMPLTKEYSKTSASDPELQGMLPSMGFGLPYDTPPTRSAKVQRSESIEVDGQSRDCWVIESRQDKAENLTDVVLDVWVEKATGIQLKTSFSAKTGGAAPAQEIRTVTTIRSMKFNTDLPDSLFTFTPPEGAKDISDKLAAVAAAPEAPAESKAERAKQPDDPEAFVPSLNPIEQVEPAEVKDAGGKSLQGLVEMLVTIDPNGSVTDVEVTSGPKGLRDAAAAAVKQWKYRPVMRDGHPVFAYTDAHVNFGVGVPDLDLSEQMSGAERRRELMDRFPRTPEQALADSEDQARVLSGDERLGALPDLAKQAYAAGDLGKASSYAMELLGAPAGYWDYGDATYTGNMVLGLVALKRGNTVDAKRYLLESGKTKGSPVLGSFGPDFMLAYALLNAGERETVAEFLTECKSFWEMGTRDGRLDTMIAEVRADGKF